MLAGPLRAAVVASECLRIPGRCRWHHLSLLVECMYYGFPHPFGNFPRAETISPPHSNHFYSTRQHSEKYRRLIGRLTKLWPMTLPLEDVGGNNIYRAPFMHTQCGRYCHMSSDLISMETFCSKCRQSHYRCEETEVQRGRRNLSK